MKKKKHILTAIFITAIAGILGFGILIVKNNKPSNDTSTSIIGNATKDDLSSAVTEKSLADLDALVEIPNVKDAIVMEVTDQKMLREFDPLFARTYKGDLVVFLPDQTIVYDPTTKTVRDIMSKSFYEEVKK